VGALAGVGVGWKQIALYFFNTSHFSPRRILLTDSIRIAAERFPLGAGFATFGSTMAAQYYSPLYTQLGYENLDGMYPGYTTYLTDSFWPIVIGQFGFIGLAFFVILEVLMLRESFAAVRKDRSLGFAMLAVQILMLVNSLAETAFFNPTSLLMFMVYGACEAQLRCGRTGKQKK